MIAIVLAAGMGSRLTPITSHRPKHLIEIAGKSILQRTLDQLLNINSISEILVVVNFQAELIIEKIEEWYDNGKITIVHQKEANGTGDAVDAALHHTTVNGNFVVINGDVLFGQPLSDFLLTNTNCLVVGAQVEDPTLFGVFEHDNLKLTGLVEKPEVAQPDSLINAGFYVFPPEAVELFDRLGYSQRGEREMTDVLEQLIQQEISIEVYPTTLGWFDVGNPWQILDANEYFMEAEKASYQILGTVEPNVSIHGQVHIAKTARIRSGVYIEGPVYIDEGADIGPNCYIRGKTYLGPTVRVGNACEIKNSLIYSGTHAAHLSYVGDSVIGQKSNLGAGTITANLRHDGRSIKMTIKGIRKDSGRRKLGVIMGDGVKTGIGVNILPGVKVTSGSMINAGEVVSRDLD